EDLIDGLQRNRYEADQRHRHSIYSDLSGIQVIAEHDLVSLTEHELDSCNSKRNSRERNYLLLYADGRTGEARLRRSHFPNQQGQENQHDDCTDYLGGEVSLQSKAKIDQQYRAHNAHRAANEMRHQSASGY